MNSFRIKQLEECNRDMFGDLIVACQTPITDELPRQVMQAIPYTIGVRRATIDTVRGPVNLNNDKRRASVLVDELLLQINYSLHNASTDYNSTSGKSHKHVFIELGELDKKGIAELTSFITCLETNVERMGSILVRQLKRRDALRRQQESFCDVITDKLSKRVSQENPRMRFTIQPAPGDTGFTQWAAAMKMVAQLPGGIPGEFRRRLWLTLAERHLAAKRVDWAKVERNCFSEWSHPDDAELGVQIVKDLHRTGCSLFCGEGGQENQALLKRVLLAYARWNKAVGYCQGFNMLAALILQVTERSESDALKLMIYLIEGVLPDSYFAGGLRGLSADMAAFRELMRARLPRLARHLDALQGAAAQDGGGSYEPPLTNVFTMQWFLTLFCNCLPQPTVLRVWDLILLEGNEILLRTALAIWQVLAERILSVRSADEFYCLMGVLTRELLEFNLIDGNALIKAVVAIGPLTELKTLREHYLYNINPWGNTLPQVVDKQLKLYSTQSLTLDISALKKQYAKLKQRQRQAHIIFSAAVTRQPPPAPPVAMNHLLLGKSALVPSKRLGPPKGAVPPARMVPRTLHWKDAHPKPDSSTAKSPGSSSSSDTELCDESDSSSDEEEVPERNASVQNGQLDDCNLPHDGDTVLMKDDNTTTTTNSRSALVELEGSTLPEDPAPVLDVEVRENIAQKSDSEDESFDFEQFLADRVKFIKESEGEALDEKKMDFGRRNSERALQIIKENSLILHRIMQCQSRLSPSPPIPLIIDENAADSEYNLDPLSAENSRENPIHNDAPVDKDEGSMENLQSPEYGYKYTSILEKSKSLDERYNALILHKHDNTAAGKDVESAPVSPKPTLRFTAGSKQEDFQNFHQFLLTNKLSPNQNQNSAELRAIERVEDSCSKDATDITISDEYREFQQFLVWKAQQKASNSSNRAENINDVEQHGLRDFKDRDPSNGKSTESTENSNQSLEVKPKLNLTDAAKLGSFLNIPDLPLDGGNSRTPTPKDDIRSNVSHSPQELKTPSEKSDNSFKVGYPFSKYLDLCLTDEAKINSSFSTVDSGTEHVTNEDIPDQNIFQTGQQDVFDIEQFLSSRLKPDPLPRDTESEGTFKSQVPDSLDLEFQNFAKSRVEDNTPSPISNIYARYNINVHPLNSDPRTESRISDKLFENGKQDFTYLEDTKYTNVTTKTESPEVITTKREFPKYDVKKLQQENRDIIAAMSKSSVRTKNNVSADAFLSESMPFGETGDKSVRTNSYLVSPTSERKYKFDAPSPIEKPMKEGDSTFHETEATLVSPPDSKVSNSRLNVDFDISKYTGSYLDLEKSVDSASDILVNLKHNPIVSPISPRKFLEKTHSYSSFKTVNDAKSPSSSRLEDSDFHGHKRASSSGSIIGKYDFVTKSSDSPVLDSRSSNSGG